jgi:CBS domain-containing protein
MSTNLKTINPDTNLEEIGDHLEMYSFHHLPVLDEGRLVGIVSASDFRQIAHGVDLVKSVQEIDLLKVYRSISADKIMTKNPFSIPPDTTLDDVAEIFAKEKFHAIPVLEQGVLVGIVTIHDVNFHKYG